MIDDLSKSLDENNIIYITDISNLDASATSALKTMFCETLNLIVKNTLLKKQWKMSEKDFTELYDILPGPTAIMLSDVGIYLQN